jgi:hypothetical protein
MSDDSKDRDSRDSSPPSEDSPRRRRLEGVIPDLLKRAVEMGLDKASEATPESLKHLMGELRLPKEVAAYIFSQVEETKNGMMRVVAKETREFLEHANLGSELQKVLTTLQFEINTTIRFRPADAKSAEEGDQGDEGEAQHLPKPEVKMDVFARRAERRRKAKEG